MNYRNTKLLAATDLNTAGTKTIDINVAQPISRINLQWIIGKLSVTMHSYPHRDITKIELVDGSDVLFSMDGGQCQALCIYDRKCPTMNHGQYINANSQRSLYGIDFGRYLFDPMLALDPTKFRNLQLKITHNQSLSDTSASVNTLEIWAELFDEKVISPIGFLMSKAHHAYTVGSADSYEYVKLPTDHPFRKMLLQGYYAAQEPWQTLKEARLSEDQDKRVPFDWNLEVYYQYRKGIDPPVEEIVAGQCTAGGAAQYLTASDYWATLVTNGEIEGDQAAIGSNGRGGYFLVKSNVFTQFQGLHRGWLPNHCFQFPFGDQMDIDDWYDVTKIGSLELRLKAGDAAVGTGAGAVILQQLRRY